MEEVMMDAPKEYQIVVGLEVHVQLLTRTKLFCGCSTEFGLPPNSATCPVCLGLPGTLPVMNRRAFELALRAALALNCRIARFTKWDRKNYYYPDLPKNYQISQYDLPLSSDGWLEINVAPDPRKGYQPKRIGIIRAHLEEDAGKLLHDETGRGGDTRVDLNRAGTPLLEIVSRPDMNSPTEAVAYLQELRLLLREMGVSDCEMQEGSLRCDANVNIRLTTAAGLVATPIVEIKNLNSIRGVERAIQYEAQRQYRAFHDPNDEAYGKRMGELPKATAGWLDDRGVTRVQRRKEEAADYRYFPDPDLVPVTVDDAWLEEVRQTMGELPSAQRQRLTEQYGLSAYDADVLVHQGRALVAYFEDVARVAGDAKAACNWVTNQVLSTLNERGQTIADFPLRSEQLGDLIAQVRAKGLNNQRARDVYAHMLEHGTSVGEAFAALAIRDVSEVELREIVRRQLAAHEKAVADYRQGNVRALDRVKGAVMKATGGMARMDLVQRLLEEELRDPERS
jgi:aspartyl-tRNA(Asn)/glutamyl-tRNA(Gln) amidotransferase subunit B